jgi:hypothetical protein
MKTYLSVVAGLLCLLSYSQKHNPINEVSELSLIQKTSIYSYGSKPQSTQEQDVKSFLEREFNVELKSLFVQSSPVAHYYLFQQTFDERSVYGAEIKVTLNLKGDVKRIDNGTVDIPKNSELSFFSEVDLDLIKGDSPVRKVNKEEIVVYNNGLFKPALEVTVAYNNYNHIKYILNKDGKQLVKQNLNMHLQVEKDTSANMVIFQPDPMTKANIFWKNGDDYDINDMNEEFLNPLRDTAFINLTYDTNTNEFILENDRCIIAEFSPPTQPIETSATPFFEYSRSHYGFEEVNAYYHVTNTQNHLVSMGFDLVGYKIEVDANALNGQDNSMFSFGTNPPRLFFGEGGVDDAEDADVVVHEYGHAISHSANGSNNNTGTERRCLDEAIGDYYAASYSYSVNPYKWENIFSWDGHNQYWSGRDGDNPSNKVYPVSFTSGNIYSHTDLWVCPLMEIYFAIGKFKTDQLVTESLYGYFSNMTFTDAALLIVQADSAYNGGVNVPVIWRVFYDKGILPSNPVSIYENPEFSLMVLGTQSFANGRELTIVNKNDENLKVKVLDLNGRMVTELNSSIDTKLNGAEFDSGVYLLVIENEKGDVQTEKLIRY